MPDSAVTTREEGAQWGRQARPTILYFLSIETQTHREMVKSRLPLVLVESQGRVAEIGGDIDGQVFPFTFLAAACECLTGAGHKHSSVDAGAQRLFHSSPGKFMPLLCLC